MDVLNLGLRDRLLTTLLNTARIAIIVTARIAIIVAAMIAAFTFMVFIVHYCFIYALDLRSIMHFFAKAIDLTLVKGGAIQDLGA